MKSSIKLAAFLLCLAVVGCMETGQQQLTENKLITEPVASDPSDPNARKGGGSTGQIYLSVTVDNLGISSDGNGAYTNGIDGVSAQFVSPDGSFSFTTNNARIRNQRKLTFPGTWYAINPNLSDNFLINVVANEDGTPTRKIQEIPEGENQLMAMRVWGSNLKGTIQFRLIYNLGTGLGYETDQVLVTRTGLKTWTVESTNDATAALTGPNNGILEGYYSVPFKLTLTQIN